MGPQQALDEAAGVAGNKSVATAARGCQNFLVATRESGPASGQKQAAGPNDYDIIVVGAGFGGLAAAITAAQEGARVLLLEALNYPGGCASTFTRHGVDYETGATLFSGLGPGQLFERWRQRFELDVRFDLLETPIELRTPNLRLPIPSCRESLVDSFCSLEGAPVASLRSFFEEQRKVADALWPIFDEPARLPPFSWSAVGWHVQRLKKYVPLLRQVARPLYRALQRHGLHDWEPLVSYLDALCQITVQTSVREAEATFAMATMDYCFRGTGHVHGGIGKLAWALLGAVRTLGGDVRLAHRVRSMRRDGAGWIVQSRRQRFRAPLVIANLLPQTVCNLTGTNTARLQSLAERLGQGWSAAMLYLTVAGDAVARALPHHLELVSDTGQPFIEGNHVFCSIAGADEAKQSPEGQRTVTVSTHVPAQTLRQLRPSEQGDYIAEVQTRMRSTMQHLAPELAQQVEQSMTASPRTWERFTKRPQGLVGGIPRRAGLANYQGLLPQPALPGLFLVGDSVFPGQSTLATALGGVRTVRSALSGSRLFL